MGAYEDGLDDGVRYHKRKIAPLIEAIKDTMVMFENIERNRDMPAFAHTTQQYIAMGKQLRRIIQALDLYNYPTEEKEQP